jgi:hypothetical protein
MSYSEFTMDDLKTKFHLNFVQDEALFPVVPESPISAELRKYLATYVPLALAIDTEKARSEYIVAQILGELKMRHHDDISLFSGIEFNVDRELGLAGRCDYIISRSGDQYSLTAPIVVMVEAKNDNIKSGIAQCGAEMLAAQKFNQQKKNEVSSVYGCVSTGTNWKFLKLNGTDLYIDVVEYYIDAPEKIMGILASVMSS